MDNQSPDRPNQQPPDHDPHPGVTGHVWGAPQRDYTQPPAGAPVPPPYASGSPPIPQEQLQAVYATPYAGFWLRFVALIIDTLILYPVGILTNMMFYGVDLNDAALLQVGVGAAAVDQLGPTALSNAAFSGLLVIAYNATCESSRWGGSLGKLLLGIRVIRDDGTPITFWRAVLRNLSKWVSSITLSIGYLMAAFTERKQALHDIMCSALVIRKV